MLNIVAAATQQARRGAPRDRHKCLPFPLFRRNARAAHKIICDRA
jgi:hypothetical protein